MNAAVVVGKGLVLNPAIAVGVPFGLFFGVFGVQVLETVGVAGCATIPIPLEFALTLNPENPPCLPLSLPPLSTTKSCIASHAILKPSMAHPPFSIGTRIPICPRSFSDPRSKQLELLAGIIHKLRTGKPFATALGKLIDLKSGKLKSKGLDARHQAALREWRHDYLKATALPTKFVKEFAEVTSQANLAWRSAKESNSFQRFSPYLDRGSSPSAVKRPTTWATALILMTPF